MVSDFVFLFCFFLPALAWTMYYLAKRQDCQDKVVAELKRVLGDEEVDSTNLSNLKYVPFFRAGLFMSLILCLFKRRSYLHRRNPLYVFLYLYMSGLMEHGSLTIFNLPLCYTCQCQLIYTVYLYGDFNDLNDDGVSKH